MSAADRSPATDPAQINIPRTARDWQRMDASLAREAERRRAAKWREQRKEARAAAQERYAARKAERDRPKLTASDVAGAVVVRTSDGWHRVVRVSAKSVTVTTAYSWTDRIPLDRVLEVRS